MSDENSSADDLKVDLTEKEPFPASALLSRVATVVLAAVIAAFGLVLLLQPVPQIPSQSLPAVGSTDQPGAKP